MTIALPAGATLRPLALPARADAGPTPLIREYAAVRNASILETSGRDDDALSADELLPMLSSSTDRIRRQWAVEHDGQIVGCCALDILQDGDGDTAMLTIALLRRAWGRGIGSAVHEHIETVVREHGAKTIVHWVEHHEDAGAGRLPSPTGAGSIPHDRAAGFLLRHGYRLEQVERGSELRLDAGTIAALRRLRAAAETHARGYRVVQWMLPTPAGLADGYAWMKSRMSTDVPDGDLGLPEERWDAARVAQHDERYAKKGWSALVTAAQRIGTGELCAFNELAIGRDPAGATHQQDTLVLAEHRGHRLGMLVKATGLLEWHRRYPASDRVITYNAEQNRPMLDINERIGFTPFTYEGAWRKDLM